VTQPPFGTAIEHHAGQEFNYAVWNADTKVSFHNVPWNSDYRDLWFPNTQAEFDNYLTAHQGPTWENMTLCPVNKPIRVGLPFNLCYKYNYLRVYNPAEPTGHGDEPRVFYYFIKDVNFLAPDTTEISVQLDVWATFSRFLTFGNCYIERGHIGVANEDTFEDHGREYLTVPEGLDVGNEYVTQFANEYTIADKDTACVLVAATTNLLADPGTQEKPTMYTAHGSEFEGLPNGMDLYLFENVTKFRAAMTYFATYPWVAQGIVSITMVPVDYNGIKTAGTGVSEVELAGGSSGIMALQLWGDIDVPGTTIVTPTFRNHFTLPARYTHLLKFKTYPYSVIEMTTYEGTPLLLKPECIATDTLQSRLVQHIAPPSARIIVYPLKYNGKKYANDTEAWADMDTSKEVINDRSEFLDMTTGIFDLPMFSIVNNSYLNYMASNAHRIAYSYQNAEWTQARAQAGVALGYNQATNSMDTQIQQAMNQVQSGYSQTDAANRNRMAQAAFKGMANMGVDIGNGAANGGMAGAVTGAAFGLGNMGFDLASAGMDNATQLAITSAQMNALQGNALLSRGNAGYQRDTNQAYGSFAAKGDYANEIAGINARVQDARLLQPTTAGQSGGSAFNIAMFKWGVFWKYKMLQPAVMAAIGEFWLRYGYAINRFGRMPANFRVMEKFTYWKLRESYITSASMPEQYKQTIRGIFEKGVTVWTNAADMGYIDIADNAPLTGVTL